MSLYPDEALDYPIMPIADLNGHDLGDTLHINEAGQLQGLDALAFAIAGVFRGRRFGACVSIIS